MLMPNLTSRFSCIRLCRIGSRTCCTTIRTFTSTNTKNNNFSTRQLNLALIGPPGSGKGSYGRYLSRFLEIPIVTVSDVLRKRRRHTRQLQDKKNKNSDDEEDEENDGDISSSKSGQLVDDHIVLQVLLVELDEIRMERRQHQQYHQEQNSLESTSTTPATETLSSSISSSSSEGIGYILDGFPRTMKQIQLMMTDPTSSSSGGPNGGQYWPQTHRIHAAIVLNVPNFVCELKLSGRRHCQICDVNFSINGIQDGVFDLPETTPPECRQIDDENDGNDRSPPSRRCVPERDWYIRDDDKSIDIIQQRLNIYHEHMDPIVTYYREQNRLFEFTPYKGYDDIPRFQTELHQWLQDTILNK